MTRTKAVLLVWLSVSLWSAALYARAALSPPPGRAFVGTFMWVDDFYNYASFAQQASDGRVLFRNKLLDPRRARSELVNLEWLLLGGVARALGGRPFLAYRLIGAAAALAFIAAAERWSWRLGVPASRRAMALVLLVTAGGLGGLVFELTDLPVSRCLDLALGAYPFVELLVNPHFLCGTALLLWALWCFSEVPAPRGPMLGILLGTVLGLVRPYDLGLLGIVRGGAILLTEPRREWTRKLLPLVGLLPVLGYDVRLFFGGSQFASFRRGAAFPGTLDFVPALGPAAALALLSLRLAGRPEAHRARVHLWLWLAAGALVVALRPGAFWLQLLVGLGVPLLLLGSLTLRELTPQAGWLLVLSMCSSAVVETRILLSEDPNWFVPAERLAAGRALGAVCRQGDRLLAPPDIGLYAIGTSACHAFVAHPAGPAYGERLGVVEAFYTSMSPQERSALLEREGITELVLPGDPGPVPLSWLGPATRFQQCARIEAAAPLLAVYSVGDRCGAGTPR